MMRSLMRRFLVAFAALCALALGQPAAAQGTLPLALQQQFSFTSCSNSSAICGSPLIGGLLYFYQVGTVATPQDSFQDSGLTLKNPWPLPLDSNGRVPFFYLASGSIHVRLTDAQGVVQYENPSVLVIGPSGGGGGGASVDPTTIFATGDIKFRPTTEFVTGWVRMNGLTVGSATSGATERANADTQSLFVYLWTNCPNATCAVSSGRGASALADFSANKTIVLIDWRGRTPFGLGDMGNVDSGRLAGALFANGNATTVQSNGGEPAHTLAQAELPAVAPTFSGAPQTVSTNQNNIEFSNSAAGVSVGGDFTAPSHASRGTASVTFTPSGTISSLGSGASGNRMPPFMLGTWYIKL